MDTIKFKSRSTRVIAHRGVSGLERENTCPAFVAAGNRSYFGVETDVHRAADGTFVIIHDETTDRVSGGKVRVNIERLPYSDYKNVVLPDLDGSLVRGDIRIPTLGEYISICKKYEKVCVLELKNPFAKEDIERMIEEIRTLGYLESMIFISFSLDNCKILRSLLPNAEIQYLTGGEVDDSLVELLKKEKLDLDILFTKLDRRKIKLLHKNNIKVNCWTVDKKMDAEHLVKAGVDFITSNILE